MLMDEARLQSAATGAPRCSEVTFLTCVHDCRDSRHGQGPGQRRRIVPMSFVWANSRASAVIGREN